MFFFAGAAVGAAIALLYAPQNGAATTKDIKKFAKKAVDHLDDLQGDIRHKVTDWVEDVVDVVKDGVDRAKKFGADSDEQVLRRFDNGRSALKTDGAASADQNA